MINLIVNSDKIQNKLIKDKVIEFITSLSPFANTTETKCFNISILFCKANKSDSLFYCEGFITKDIPHAWVKYDTYNIDLKAIWMNERADKSVLGMIGKSKSINEDLPLVEIKSTSQEFNKISTYFKSNNFTIPKSGIIGLQQNHKINVFSMSNYTLKRYVTKILSYSQKDSDSLKEVVNKLRGVDDYVLDLIGGNDKYNGLTGLERINYINELLADARYRGNDTLKHISYAARTLKYEHKLENMNKDEVKVFSELSEICATKGNRITRKLFNQLVKSFSLQKVDFNDLKVGEIISEDGGDENTGEITKIDTKTRSVTILPKEATREIVVKYSTNDSDNEIMRVYSECSACGGASVSAAGVADGGVDLKGEPLNQAEIDDKVQEASRATFSDQIKSFDDYKSWIHNFMQQAHGENYDEDLTEKIANELNKKYNGDFGAMIGAAKSFLHE